MGKTTVAHEVCRQLEAAGVAHAMIDADELDRVYPPPGDDPNKTDLTRRNLAAVWTNLRDAGAPRLILTMVAVSLEEELEHVREAVPEARIVAVRLRAPEDVLLERVRRREVGSGLGYQAPRTLGQSRSMAQESGPEHIVANTSGRSVPEVARELLNRAGWITRNPGEDVASGLVGEIGSSIAFPYFLQAEEASHPPGSDIIP